jgi:hypothetical protein
MHTFKVGHTIYRAFRYWKTDNLQRNEIPGWNVNYLPYRVIKITAKRITVARYWPLNSETLQLDRAKMETEGQQYHSKVHEYFHAEIPKAQPKATIVNSSYRRALTLLGLVVPYSPGDVKSAYKRLALKYHPDIGGSHDEFVRLQEARDIALRRY